MELVDSSIKRGCGFRKEGGLYACVPTGAGGRPIEAFVLDPAIPWTAGPFRGAIQRQNNSGVNDLIVWVGKEHYPYVSDFIEEARRYGVSRRIPLGADSDYSGLIPFQSRLILVHPRGIYRGPYATAARRPDDGLHPRIFRPTSGGECNHAPANDGITTPCTFALWDLSAAKNAGVSGKHDLSHSGQQAIVNCPSFDYEVATPIEPQEHDPRNYHPAIVAVFPLGQFEYVNPDGGLPESVAGKLGPMVRNTAVTST